MIDLAAIIKALPASEIPAALTLLAARSLELAAANGRNACAPSDLIDAPTLAAHLGVAESFVRTAARSGRIPCVRVGRYVRFRVAEVERALAEHA